MKRSTKLSLISSLLMLFFLLFTGLASADVLRGKGWLHAEGNGFAKLTMTGQVEIKGHDAGVVYIYGAEAISAVGEGRRVDRPNGGVIFYGFEGEIVITGEHMIIKMVGRKIDFTAEGKGKAVLHGKGTYETRNGSGDWQPDGLTIEVEEEV